MFDTVTCDYPLPLPEEVKDLKSPPDWASEKFQTKSFDSVLTDYSIEEDGQMYRSLTVREIIEDNGKLKMVEKDEGIERVDFTGEVKFYTVHMEEGFDYFIEFITLFWKGDLKEISLSEWRKMDNSDRIKNLSAMEERLEERESKRNKWWYKPKQYFAVFVRVILFLVRWPIGYIARLTWKIERWLT